MTCVAKQTPGDRDCICVGQGPQQGGQSVVTRVNVDKLINVQRHQPIGLLHQRVFVGQFIASPLDAALPIGAIIAQVDQLSHILQAIQHCICAIVAIIGQHQKIGEPDAAMMGQPFQQEGPFVFHAENGGGAHLPAFLEGNDFAV